MRAEGDFREDSTEEEDNLRRSVKRSKAGELRFSDSVSRVPREEDWMVEEGGMEKLSFRDTLMKHNGELEDAENLDFDMNELHDEEPSEDAAQEILREIDQHGRANFVLTKTASYRLRKKWRLALIVKLLGKTVGVGFMKKKLATLWSKTGSIMVSDIGNEFFAVQFSDKDDLNAVLTGGPWLIMGHYLSIRRWEPEFDPDLANIMKIAAWIRLPALPMEYYDTQFLKAVGDWVGKTLKIDKTTSTMERGRFARLCVELDLSKPLKAEYLINGNPKKIEYEGLYLICFQCGKYGHRKDACPTILQQANSDMNTGAREEDGDIQGSEYLGPWMVAARSNRGRRGAGVGTERESKKQGGVRGGNLGRDEGNLSSRFNVLTNFQEGESAAADNYLQMAPTNDANDKATAINGHLKFKKQDKGKAKLVEGVTQYQLVWDHANKNNYADLAPPNNELVVKQVGPTRAGCASRQPKNNSCSHHVTIEDSDIINTPIAEI